MSYSRSNIVVRPSTKIECRYCHAIDHVKGSFNKKTKSYTLSCPALIAKNNRIASRSLRRTAISNSRNKKQLKVDPDGFSSIKATIRVKSPGPRVYHTQQNRFASFDESSEKSIDLPVKSQKLTTVWAQRPNIFGKEIVTIPKTVSKLSPTRHNLVSSPQDQALLERKRLNQFKSQKPRRSGRSGKSWADMADSDSESDSDEEDE